jgi:hypothetical protein
VELNRAEREAQRHLLRPHRIKRAPQGGQWSSTRQSRGNRTDVEELMPCVKRLHGNAPAL